MSKSKKILIVCGPTATGKTSLAVKLAKKLNGELISADSRQVYQGLDIGTGKDHPPGTKIHALDLIPPSESFSVSQYLQTVHPLIQKIQSQGKLPIIVGGTGLYLKALTQGIATASIPPHPALRQVLNLFPLSWLKFILKLINPKKYKQMNRSDQNNPRRLIRALEISLSSKSKHLVSLSSPPSTSPFPRLSANIIYLSAPLSYLYQQIDQRVKKRLDQGLLQEIEKLLEKYPWSAPSFKTLGYADFQPFFQKGDSLENCISRWRFHEHAYARRQLTWFKKQPATLKINISKPNWYSLVLRQLGKWYT